MKGKGLEKAALVVFVAFLLTFTLTPVLIVLVNSFTSAEYLSFPPPGFSFKWYERFFDDEFWIRSFLNSFRVAIPVTFICTALGTLAAYAYRKYTFRAKEVASTLVILPYMLSGIIIGVGLLIMLGHTPLSGTYLIVITGHVLWITPLVYLTMQSVFANYDFSLEEAAKSLGASPIRTFFEVTLPVTKSGIIVSALLSFVNSFGEFIIALFLTNERTITLPVMIWTALKYEISPAVAAASGVTTMISLSLLAVVNKLVGIEAIARA